MRAYRGDRGRSTCRQRGQTARFIELELLSCSPTAARPAGSRLHVTPRLLDRFRDADPRRPLDRRGPHRRHELEGRHAQIRVVVLAREAERLRQAARAGAEKARVVDSAPLAHDVEPVGRLECAQTAAPRLDPAPRRRCWRTSGARTSDRRTAVPIGRTSPRRAAWGRETNGSRGRRQRRPRPRRSCRPHRRRGASSRSRQEQRRARSPPRARRTSFLEELRMCPHRASTRARATRRRARFDARLDLARGSSPASGTRRPAPGSPRPTRACDFRCHALRR